MPDTEEDAILIARYLTGDTEAFAALFQKYASAIYARAYAITLQANDADDVTQETFLRAYYHLGTFEQKSSLLTWLSRIAVHCCFHHHRRQQQNCLLQHT